MRIEDIGNNRAVRIGTYGDGAAVPSFVWKKLVKKSNTRTGYSHQANTKGADFDASLFMRSVESLVAVSYTHLTLPTKRIV